MYLAKKEVKKILLRSPETEKVENVSKCKKLAQK